MTIPPTKHKSTDDLIECVQIKNVGTFSRNQIETCRRVQNLKEVVQLGLDMHKWLLEKGMPSLPAEYHESARKVASEVMATFPYKRINGLSNLPEYTYSILYRATPLTWLTMQPFKPVANV
ncbi:hypothetical protein L916_08778 [Phytophthora nicotianae]|nr:hypothetical protein L916_08778 [Phytophthora nicotianae]